MAIVIKDISFSERTHVLTTPDWTNTMDITFNYSFTLQNTGSSAVNFYSAFIPSTVTAPTTSAALLESEGVTILTCGTCLDFYGLKEKLAVGGVTNMYEIVQRMESATTIVRP